LLSYWIVFLLLKLKEHFDISELAKVEVALLLERVHLSLLVGQLGPELLYFQGVLARRRSLSVVSVSRRLQSSSNGG
jgi:hypothetical protein